MRFAPKDFRQRRRNGADGWTWNLNGTKRVLYRLPRVLAAVERGEAVFVVEGEKDVHALEQRGMVATCNAGGAGKWRDDYSTCLKGAEVIVVADRDKPGRKHALAVAKSLQGVASEVNVVEPTLGKDMAEHLAKGGRPLQVQELAATPTEEAAQAKPTETSAVTPPGTGELLDTIADAVEHYVILPSSHARTAVALWAAHTWALDGAHATPYLLVLSPERRSGKTRLLEVLELLVRAPWRIASASEAAMFRKINDHKPTLLLDEIDAIFGSATERTEPLRAVLNSGNRPGSSVARCVGDGAKQEVVDFEVYCPKILAGIDTGRVPDTITDRSIRIAMKRKTPGEQAAAFRHRYAKDETTGLRDGAEAWGDKHSEGLLNAEPNLPAGLNDRAGEAWEPLFAIADLAGGDWPAQARAAAVALIGDDADEPGHGARLLAALQKVFADHAALATAAILEEVNTDDELPFGGWRHGDGLDARGLSRLLRPYAVRPRTIRLDGETMKGYRRDQFDEAFARYLPPTPQSPSQASQPSQPAPGLEPDVTDVTDVTANPQGAAKSAEHLVNGWTDEAADAFIEQAKRTFPGAYEVEA